MALSKLSTGVGRCDGFLRFTQPGVGNLGVVVVAMAQTFAQQAVQESAALTQPGDGADFKSLTESIDTTSAAGRMMMQMLASFADDAERAMLRERTKLGLARARAKGRKGGARSKLSLAGQKEAISMINAGKTQTEVAEFFNVHRSTISRLVSERRVLERKGR
jgi:hypothetical protein